MLSDYGFVICKGEFGFKNFLKYVMFDVEFTLINFESVGLQNKKDEPDRIAIAKRIKRLYEEFFNSLSDDEKEVIERIKRGKIPFDEYRQVYGEMFRSCYSKYEKTFFKQHKVYGYFNACILGDLIQAVRKKHNIPRAAVTSATGYSYTRVRHFEMGNTIPPLEFLFKFAKMFHCSIDEMLKISSRTI